MPVFRHVGVHILAAAICCCGATPARAQTTPEKPTWCRQPPRPEYSELERIPVADTWFEVYKVAPAVFAIYEPHQFEETISYLVLGRERALLFDSGMGIGDLKTLTTKLTTLPVTVLNSHTHNDHVGDNWQFDTVYGTDAEFTRQSAKGSKADAQAEIVPGEVCGPLPARFNRSVYATRPWRVTKWLHDSDSIDLGGRTIQVIATPGHTPDSICLVDRANGLLFSEDTRFRADRCTTSPPVRTRSPTRSGVHVSDEAADSRSIAVARFKIAMKVSITALSRASRGHDSVGFLVRNLYLWDQPLSNQKRLENK